MPSEVYSILVKAGYKGTEQEMYRTFALNGISPSIIANWTAGYNLIKAVSNAGDVLTSNGAGTDPTWQAPQSVFAPEL